MGIRVWERNVQKTDEWRKPRLTMGHRTSKEEEERMQARKMSEYPFHGHVIVIRKKERPSKRWL